MSIHRAVFDTNIYLSLLLSPDWEGSAAGLLLGEAGRRSFELLLPTAVISELNEVVARRVHLSQRISSRQIELLFRRVTEFATLLPLLSEVPPRICRDPNDDFLVASAVAYGADFIVTRDKDLLELGAVLNVRIVDPVTFLELMRGTPE